ncbi:MAG: hypothetical protein AAF961_01990, partial [Planctomycetota bacterium]
VLVFWAVSIAVNVTYQAAHGYTDFEFDLHLVDSFVFKAPYYLFFAVLALTMQIIVRQRYVAMGLVLLVYLSETLMDALGWYHPMWRYGRMSVFWYSLMDGYGHFWRPHLWLALYWSLGATWVWLVGLRCWRSGCSLFGGRSARHLQKKRLGGGLAPATWLVAAAFLITGVHIWRQSTVFAPWPPIDADKQMASVENAFADQWRNVPQPRIVRIRGELDLYPNERRLRFVGEQTLENQSQRPIDRLLVLAEPGLRIEKLEVGNGGSLAAEFDAQNAREYELKASLAPGERMTLKFVTSSAPPSGFAVHAQNDNIPEVGATEVIGNGTSLLNLQLMPAVGYSDRVEHKPTWKRRWLGLLDRWQPPSDDNVDEPHPTAHVGWVESVDMTIRTDADQSAWHAGRLVRQWTESDGRRAFRYVVDRPSRGWSEILTGRYACKRFDRQDLPEVVMVYDEDHDDVIVEFAAALHDAMSYYADRYGRPPFEQFPMVEQSLHFDGMGARSGIGFCTEVLGWKSDLQASGGEDLAKLSAHMMGMSWFNDQLIAANTPGAKIVYAGLPYWSAILYLHQQRDAELDRQLRLQEMMEMFRGRSQMIDEESPFVREMKDSTMLRRKGGILMTYLASLVGVDTLERIIAEFLVERRYGHAPFATGRDFMNHLRSRTNERYHPLVADIFEHVTTWRLRVVEAHCTPVDDGRWNLTATVEVAKFRTSGWGEQTEVPCETPVSVAAFRGSGFAKDDVLQAKLVRLPSGRSDVTMTLPEEPTRFGIDPYLLLPDRSPHDNVRNVR